MPQYYTGANPETAASTGLMAGFDFVDRIFERRRQREMQERAEARADRQMQLIENADDRAERSLTFNQDIASSQLELAKNADARAAAAEKRTADEYTRAVRERDEIQSARRALAGSMDFSGAPTLQSIGAGGVMQTAPATPTAAAPIPAKAPAPTEPVDLRAAQRERDDQPGFIERITNAFSDTRKRYETTKKASFWKDVADVNKDVEISGSAARMGIAPDPRDAPQAVRRNPLQYVDRYLADRDAVDATSRKSLDLTMANALKERRAELVTDNSPAAKESLARVEDQLNKLSKAMLTSAMPDAGINRPTVKADDERLVPAIVDAAKNATAVQDGMVVASPDELRGARALAARVSGAKRLNQKQVQALTTLYAYGQISTEELHNWSKYGAPIAPPPPKVTALGSGYGVVATENGIAFIGLHGAGAPGGLKDSEVRQREQNAVKFLSDQLGSLVSAGELSDGSAQQHMAKLLQFIQREGQNIGIPGGGTLVDQQGKLHLEALDPGTLAELVAGYEAYDKGEVQPWIRKGGKSFSEYLPSGEQVIDLTDAFR